MDGKVAGVPNSGAQGLTRLLVQRALDVRQDGLAGDVGRVARDCLIDWLGCAFAGLEEPVVGIVAQAARDEGGNAHATILGQATRATLSQAALVNGTASHALDYDDVNLSVPGHMSAAMFPALLALAEYRNETPQALLTAFVAGYEFACSVGKLVEPAHYANGFHATATIGCLGAAVACARLLELAPEQACHAVGIAATQAAGLKAMFGSMAKPLHAGLASQAGLRSALFASKGLVARVDALECEQGFVQAHGADFHVTRAVARPDADFHILHNLFKFHAACYSTHSTIEAVLALRREHGNDADLAGVSAIEVVAGQGCSICNIREPRTALQAKFSLRATAAFALLGIDTSGLQSWHRVTEPAVVQMLHRVTVKLVPGMSLSDSIVTLVLNDGRRLRQAYDCGAPMADKAVQSERVAAKFRALSAAALGGRVEPIVAALASFDSPGKVVELMALCRAGTAPAGANRVKTPS